MAGIPCLDIPDQSDLGWRDRNLRKETHCYWRSQMTQMLCACARSVLNIMLLVSATSHMPCRNII
jgi:hypothetical protein